MKIVVDTNVIVSGLIADGVCRDIVKRYLPVCDLITSAALLDELDEIMRDKFSLNPADLPFLKVYADEATIVKSKPLAKSVCRDKDDDELLSAAIAGKVEIILTGDKDLLALKEFQGIKIFSPRQFLELMDSRK